MRRLIYFDEREMLLCEWAREYHMKRQTLARRLNSGWDIETALTHPVRDPINMDAAVTGSHNHKMNDIQQLQVGLFTEPVKVGDINPPGEAGYAGYQRQTTLFIGDNIESVSFPVYLDDEPLLITHLAVMQMNGLVVCVKPAEEVLRMMPQ